MENLFKLFGIGALLYTILQKVGYGIAEKISVGQIKFKVLGTSFSALNARLSIPFINASNVSLPVDAFKGQILYGQYQLANINLTNAIILNAGQTITSEFNLRIEYSNLASQLSQLIQDGSYLNNLRIKGHVVSKGIVIPVDQNIQLI